MSRAGRKRKPAPIRAVEGNRGHRPIPDEPQFPQRTSAPSFLDTDAKNAWRRLYPILTESKVLTRADRDTLAEYCACYSRWAYAERAIKKHHDKYGTLIYKSKSGMARPIPEISIADQAISQLRALSSLLGLNPADRSRVSLTENKAPQDPLAEFLFGPQPVAHTEDNSPN